ncbi:MAG: helix-turn-helix domain-containing protein [Actinomycetales bacterium]|nr:helix-turn-helix domain-containing protein [Actinomycetales bacterium]
MTAGRRLRGTIARTATGWRAEVPASRGSRKRTKRSFPDEAQAQRWLDAAIAVLHAGGRPADLELPPGTAGPAAALATAPSPAAATTAAAGQRPPGTDFRSVAYGWWQERYVRLRRAGTGRAERVRSIIDHHLVPFFERHGYADGSDVERDAFVAWLCEYAYGTGTGDDDVAAGRVPASVLLTIDEAVALTGASRSTIKRDLRAGAYPGSRIDEHGRRLVPARDLRAAGRMSGPLRPGPRRADGGYAGAVIGDIRSILTHILEYGRDTAGWSLRFDSSADSIPTPATPEPPRRMQLTLEECGRLARHLHPVHQLVLWLIRIFALRISEAYGITVDDVSEQGERGLVRIQGQGGRRFDVRDERGRAVRADATREMKTRQSARHLIAPIPLMGLIRLAIDVFHTLPDGTVRPGARLVPGLRRADAGGQAAFRHALREAALAEGITVGSGEDVESVLLPTPKDSRAGSISDLAYEGVSEVVRKRWSGHAAGTDVHHRHYVLDDRTYAPMLEAAQAMERLIAEALPCGLVTPTTASCTTGHQPALRVDKGRIDAALVDAGWLVSARTAHGEPAMTAGQACDLLGVNARTVRQWVRDGRLTAARPGADGTPLMIPTQAVLDLAGELSSRRRLADVAADLHVDYERAYYLVRREHLEIEQAGPSAPVTVPAATEARLRSIVEAERELAARAATIAEAAGILGVSPAAVQSLIEAGSLAEIPERGWRGSRLITRASIREARRALAREQPRNC